MNPNDLLILVCFVVAVLGILALGAKVLHDEVAHNRKMAKLIAARRKNNQ